MMDRYQLAVRIRAAYKDDKHHNIASRILEGLNQRDVLRTIVDTAEEDGRWKQSLKHGFAHARRSAESHAEFETTLVHKTLEHLSDMLLARYDVHNHDKYMGSEFELNQYVRNKAELALLVSHVSGGIFNDICAEKFHDRDQHIGLPPRTCASGALIYSTEARETLRKITNVAEIHDMLDDEAFESSFQHMAMDESPDDYTRWKELIVTYAFADKLYDDVAKRINAHNRALDTDIGR